MDDEWSDTTCTAVLAAIIAIPIYPALGFAPISLVAHAVLVLIYFGLVKMFGSGSVVSMGILVFIFSILFLLILPQIVAEPAAPL